MSIWLLMTVHFGFVFAFGFYFITAMQWYSYRLERVLFHYNRYDWHMLLFVFPLIGYYLLDEILLIVWLILFVSALYFWHRKLDKKLVITSRIKRFFLFLAIFTIFQDLLCLLFLSGQFGIIIPLALAQFASMTYEKILFSGFKKEAQRKLASNEKLKIVAITASYGKTSIKNYLAQILSPYMRVYKTPRSVNTLAGIIKDINEELPSECDVYIVEAGARNRGDIYEISSCINPHIAVVGSIGEQHIEYFKTIENIRNTKMEIIRSNRLEKAFVHDSANIKPTDTIRAFGSEIKEIDASLMGLSFKMELDGALESFKCELLGEFNAVNIVAAIHVALEIGLSIEEIKKSVANLKGVEHRLQRIEAGGKLIVDDSFNGNLEGMLCSYELAKTHQGRKVIVTPGIVESTEEANRVLAKKIDEVFDVVIITGKTNLKVLDANIVKAQKFLLSDKAKLQSLLAEQTSAGDLILFSNDAPSYI